MLIREASSEDFKHIWTFFSKIIQDQTSYAFDPNLTEDDAFHLWMEVPINTFVAIKDDTICGSYFIPIPYSKF